jgi:hypothetical protein
VNFENETPGDGSFSLENPIAEFVTEGYQISKCKIAEQSRLEYSSIRASAAMTL